VSYRWSIIKASYPELLQKNEPVLQKNDLNTNNLQKIGENVCKTEEPVEKTPDKYYF
jgi:hypothetical protein